MAQELPKIGKYDLLPFHERGRPAPRTNGTIVWDMDSTVVHSSSNMKDFEQLRLYSDPSNYDIRNRCVKFDFIFRGEKCTHWTIFRPDAVEAMRFSFENYRNVVVWSAGVDEYVEQLVKYLFRDLPEPDLWFGRSFCDPKQQVDGILYKKPLTKLWERYPEIRPESTIIIEDRAAVIATNPNHGVLIPAYEPSPNPQAIREHDDNLRKLMNWAKSPECLRCKDISLVPKKHIFTSSEPPVVVDYRTANPVYVTSP